MTVKDILERDAGLASKAQALLKVEDEVSALIKEGKEIPADLEASYGRARDAVRETSEDLIRKAETAEANEIDAALIEGFDNPEAKELHAKNNIETLSHLEEAYELIQAGEKVRFEFLGSQAALDTKRNTGHSRARQECYKPSKTHFIWQEQALVTEEVLAALDPSMVAVDYSAYAGKKDREELRMQGMIGRSTMAMVAATDPITTGTTGFPDLTTFAGQMEQSRDAFAPMTRPERFNVYQTPGNVAKKEYSTIKDDGEATWDTLEGQAPTESNSEFAPITIYCKQLLKNGSFSRWADWDTFLNSLPNELRKSQANAIFRKLNEGLTTGLGANPDSPVGAPKGVLKAIDDHISRYSIPSGDAYLLKDKGADANTNPFSFRDIGNLIDLMDDGVAQGSKVFLMAHKRFFGNIRDNLFATNPGAVNGMWPIADLSKKDRQALLYGSLWMELALNNSAMSIKYDAGNTIHCAFLNGEDVLVRYLPLITEFNTSRISDSRRVAVESTSGGWVEITASGAENASSAVAAKSNA